MVLDRCAFQLVFRCLIIMKKKSKLSKKDRLNGVSEQPVIVLCEGETKRYTIKPLITCEVNSFEELRQALLSDCSLRR